MKDLAGRERTSARVAFPAEGQTETPMRPSSPALFVECWPSSRRSTRKRWWPHCESPASAQALEYEPQVFTAETRRRYVTFWHQSSQLLTPDLCRWGLPVCCWTADKEQRWKRCHRCVEQVNYLFSCASTWRWITQRARNQQRPRHVTRARTCVHGLLGELVTNAGLITILY